MKIDGNSWKSMKLPQTPFKFMKIPENSVKIPGNSRRFVKDSQPRKKSPRPPPPVCMSCSTNQKRRESLKRLGPVSIWNSRGKPGRLVGSRHPIRSSLESPFPKGGAALLPLWGTDLSKEDRIGRFTPTNRKVTLFPLENVGKSPENP